MPHRASSHIICKKDNGMAAASGTLTSTCTTSTTAAAVLVVLVKAPILGSWS